MPEREFRSFGELAAADETQREQERAELKDRYEQVLAGRFAEVPEGAFTTDLDRVPAILITRPPAAEKGKASLNVHVTYADRAGKEHAFTGSIFESGGTGLVSATYPRDFPVNQETLSREVLRTLDRVNIGFWRFVDERIFPTADPGEFPGGVPIESGGGKATRIDPERIAFLSQHQRALFGFVSTEKGFRGYHGVVLPDRMLLEHPEVGNAAFVVRLDPPMALPELTFARPPKQRLGARERAAVLEQRITPLLQEARTKQTLRAMGARRVVHTPRTWKQRLGEALAAPFG